LRNTNGFHGKFSLTIDPILDKRLIPAILLKDMPTIRSIEVNHNIGSDVNASTLEECNFRKKVQITTLSDSEVQIRIPAGPVDDMRPDLQNENDHHDRLYFQWYWSTPGAMSVP